MQGTLSIISAARQLCFEHRRLAHNAGHAAVSAQGAGNCTLVMQPVPLTSSNPTCWQA